MDAALFKKVPFILDRNLAKANCIENHFCISCDASTIHREKKLSHFDLKSWVTGSTKIRLAKWVTGEYSSQFDSQCWVNLTLNVELNLTLNVESIWLSMMS